MQKKLVFLLIGLVILAAVPVAFAGQYSSAWQEYLAGHSQDRTVGGIITMSDQVDLRALQDHLYAIHADRQLWHETVVRALQEKATTTQADILSELADLESQGRVSNYHGLWVGNVIIVNATPDVFDLLMSRDDVERVSPNYDIEEIAPVSENPDNPPTIASVENGLFAIGADSCWAIGITGEGRLVSHLDTGADGSHPALSARWRGVADPRYASNPEWAWYDPVTQTDFPFDNAGHGTHTMGTMCGRSDDGDTVGVAPDAQWISAGVIDRISIERTVADALTAFEWITDPDLDPSTVWDVPDVNSNSWGVLDAHGYPPCDETFWTVLDGCEAAGVVVNFAAGNEGSSPQTIRRPADRATTDTKSFSVGAVNGNDFPDCPIAYFSSRGPSFCTPDGSEAIKPEVSAPGMDVRSSIPGGGYGFMSGTSMATPHVSGAVALIRQANPNLSSEQVHQILMQTAVDKGTPGEDNDYGAGVINVYEAVLLARAYLQGWGTLSGIITDQGSGAPLPGAMITVQNRTPQLSCRARGDGHYFLFAPADTNWIIKVENPPNHLPVFDTISVVENDTVYENYALEGKVPVTIKCSFGNPANCDYRSFFLKGSWNADGFYDPSWSAPQVEIKDDGLAPDSIAADGIFTGRVLIGRDMTHTFSWAIYSENYGGEASRLQNGTDFTVHTLPPFTLPTLSVNPSGSYHNWMITASGDHGLNLDLTQNAYNHPYLWAGAESLTVGTTYTFKFTVMHSNVASYGVGGVGGANLTFTPLTPGAYEFRFDDRTDTYTLQLVGHPSPRNLVATSGAEFSMPLHWNLPPADSAGVLGSIGSRQAPIIPRTLDLSQKGNNGRMQPPMLLGSGGPDSAGYTWVDSDEPGGPTFEWRDITGIGTPMGLSSDDQNAGPFDIGFEFPFYGTNFTQFYAVSNGWFSFTDNVNAWYFDYALPDPLNAPLNLLAPFWDDLNFSGGGQSFVYTDGNECVIEYVDVPHYSAGGPYTFEVVLRRSGTIIFQYLSMGDPTNSASIGIQNGDGSIGLQVVFDADYVHDNLAIQLQQAPEGVPPVHYKLYRATAPNVPIDPAHLIMANIPGTDDHTIDTNGVLNGIPYYYKLSAVWPDSVESAPSNEASGTAANAAPEAPTGLTGTVNGHDVTLDWAFTNIHHDFDHFNIYRKLVPGGSPILAGTSVTTHAVITIPAGQDGVHAITVTAVDNGTPQLEGSASNTFFAPVGNLPPNALRATGDLEFVVPLNWAVPGLLPDTLIQYDDGVLANGWYFYDFGSFMANQFVGEPGIQLDTINVHVLTDGDAYWPWPDGTHDPILVMVFDDNGSGQPGDMVFSQEATGEPGMDVIVPIEGGLQLNGPNFWIGATNVTGGGEEGFGDDATTDYPEFAWYYFGGTWTQGSYYPGDQMIRASIVSQGRRIQLTEKTPTTELALGNAKVTTARVNAPVADSRFAASASSSGIAVTPSRHMNLGMSRPNNDIRPLDVAVEGYNIYRATAPNVPIDAAHKIRDWSLQVGTAYLDSAVTNGTTYYYKVTAEYHNGTVYEESPPTNEASATPTNHPPEAPTNLVGSVSNRDITLDWAFTNIHQDFDHFNIWKKAVPGGTPVLAGTSSTTHAVITIPAGGDGVYAITITAVDNGTPQLEGPASNTFFAPVGNLPPNALRATGDQEFVVPLNWAIPGLLPDTLIQYDDGVLANAWYFYDFGSFMANQFVAEPGVQLDTINVHVLTDNDQYWPWPDGTHDPILVMVFDDNGSGQPGDMVFSQEATGEPGMDVLVGIEGGLILNGPNFWIGATNVDGGGDEGFGVDANTDFPQYAWYSMGGTWTQGSYYPGDQMIRASIVSQGRRIQLTEKTPTTELALGNAKVTTANINAPVADPRLSASASSSGIAVTPSRHMNLGMSRPNNDIRPLDVAVEGYNIYRSTAPNVQIIPGNKIRDWSLQIGTAYLDSDVTNGTTYYYKVTAEYHNGTVYEESPPTNEASATPTNHPPEAPTNLVGSVSNRDITLDWAFTNIHQDFDHFNIWKKAVPGGTRVLAGTSSTTHAVITIPAGGDGVYAITVTAVDNGTPQLEGGESNSFFAPVGNLPPTNLRATDHQDANVPLRWNTPGLLPDTLIQYDDGVLTNGWYFYDFGSFMANQFVGEPGIQLDTINVHVLTDGDAYWPWPDGTHDPILVMVFDDNGSGQPGDMVFSQEATGEPGMDVLVGIEGGLQLNGPNFWIGATNVAGGGEEGFGDDAATDYPEFAWYYFGGTWTQGSYYPGDQMIRASIVSQGRRIQLTEKTPTTELALGNAKVTTARVNAPVADSRFAASASSSGIAVTPSRHMNLGMSRPNNDIRPLDVAVEGYNIYRATAPNVPIDAAHKIRDWSLQIGTNYIDSAVINGTTYYYKVTAEYHNGTVYEESPPTNEASATPVLGARMVVNPLSIEVSGPAGQITTTSLNISNPGGLPLNWGVFGQVDQTRSLANVHHTNPIGLPAVLLDGDKSNDPVAPVNPPMLLGRGGPDAYGYTWIDSDEPGGPAVNWIDITGIGEQLPLANDDQNVGPYDIGFSFPYYGGSFSTINICSNGWASFTSTNTDYYEYPLPDPNSPENMLAPFWDDMYLPYGGAVWFYTDGSQCVISWVDIMHIGTGGPYSYEIVLNSSGLIQYNYDAMNDPMNSCTIGWQNGDRSDGLTVVYDADYVHSNMTINISAGWLSASPGSGVVPAGNNVNVSVICDATLLSVGTYTGTLVVSGFDENHQLANINVPVTFHVTIQGIGDNSSALPKEFALSQNYPNPFNPTTQIEFALPTKSLVSLEIYNVLGQRVRTLVDGVLDAGYKSVVWDGMDQNGSSVSSGTYFYKLDTGGKVFTKKMTMLK